MKSIISVFALVLAYGVMFWVPPAQAQPDVCTEAQERYRGLDIEKPMGDGIAVVLTFKYNFCPKQLVVKKGAAVHFINVDKRTSHSVWFKEAGKEESDRFFPDEGWSVPMLSAGEFPYLCGPHWEQEGMIGKVIVTE